ncbi:MAG: rhomboid family intramembrane serine protease [Chitinophagales bacterium]|nr:MAG: rhomboid family intramembrane serine protease [Chitinophagales bacterium]
MYEYQPSRFNPIPHVVKNLLIINGLVYLATILFGEKIFYRFGLFYIGSDYFRPYQFVTHMFVHGGFLHIFSNMFALWMFGTALENIWGPKRFLFFYFFCGLGAAVLHSGVTYWEIHYVVRPEVGAVMANVPTVGASGAVFGVLLAFGMIFPNTQLMLLFPPIPIKAKYFVLFYALFELYAGLSSIGGMGAGMNIAHFAHLGGMLFAYILIRYWNKANRRRFF